MEKESKKKLNDQEKNASPITRQPKKLQMELLEMVGKRPKGCPPGLESLCFVDNLVVKQRVQPLEIVIGYEQGNKYEVFNGMGQRVLVAAEDTDCCTRNCCGRCRPWKFLLMDGKSGTDVIHLSRGLRCSTCWCPCCLQKVKVFAPPGHLIGCISQDWSLCFPALTVTDESGKSVLKISGPFCTFSCLGSEVEFEVLSKDKSHLVGRIAKEWGGLIKEGLTDADNFNLHFPLDLDVRCKALLLGVTLLIDFMFFEDNPGQIDAPGMAAN